MLTRCLYDKQNNTWLLGGISSRVQPMFNSMSHEFAALTREISNWTLKEEFHISVWRCIILHIKYCDCTFKIALNYMQDGLNKGPSAFLITWQLLVVKNVDDKGDQWVSTKSYSSGRHKWKVYDPQLRNNSNINATCKVTNWWFMLKTEGTYSEVCIVMFIKIQHASNNWMHAQFW